MEEVMLDSSQMTSQQALCDPTEQQSRKRPGPSTLKVLKPSVTSTSLMVYLILFLWGILLMHSA